MQIISTRSTHEKSKKNEGAVKTKGEFGRKTIWRAEMTNQGSAAPSMPLFLAALCVIWLHTQDFHGMALANKTHWCCWESSLYLLCLHLEPAPAVRETKMLAASHTPFLAKVGVVQQYQFLQNHLWPPWCTHRGVPSMCLRSPGSSSPQPVCFLSATLSSQRPPRS